jgi:DNA-binding response OmpR family regulator
VAHILLVEDSPTVGRLLLHQLDSWGHSALHALSIAEALAILGNPDLEVDLLLVDLVLPDGSGARLAQHCRTEGRELPILFITGWPEFPPALDGVEEWRVLTKPFRRGELAGAVQRALDESPRRSSTTIEPCPSPGRPAVAAAARPPRGWRR